MIDNLNPATSRPADGSGEAMAEVERLFDNALAMAEYYADRPRHADAAGDMAEEAGYRGNVVDARTKALDAIRALVAASSASGVSDRGKLVPIEPTKAMRAAFHKAQMQWKNSSGLDSPDHQWAAMLAAAPQPPTTAARPAETSIVPPLTGDTSVQSTETDRTVRVERVAGDRLPGLNFARDIADHWHQRFLVLHKDADGVVRRRNLSDRAEGAKQVLDAIADEIKRLEASPSPAVADLTEAARAVVDGASWMLNHEGAMINGSALLALRTALDRLTKGGAER